MNKNIEIIGMIYKSTQYLKMMINEFKSEYNTVDGWDIKYRIIANDANQNVLNALTTYDVPFSIYNDPKPYDYYLNRVYRAWNFGGFSSGFDNICFVNSDMIFSIDWLKNLIKHHDGINIPTSRLVESGKMPSGLHGISNNFGRSPNSINREGFIRYSEVIKKEEIHDGGLYMPCIFETSRFKDSGGFPEGNIYHGGPGAHTTGFIKSGDDYYFHDVLESKFGMKHITVFDSIVYHLQEGEKDE